MEVLSLVRSTRNSFALVNKIPPDVLSLIPNCWEDDERDKALIKLTHVCHGWRELFTSHPLLWTRLDCISVDKTKVYIERSKSSPLEIFLAQTDDMLGWEEAFILTVPHIGRLRTLSVSGNPAQVLPVLGEHLFCPVPLLENLRINLICDQVPILPDKLFNGDLSSLREMGIGGVITPLPWRGLSNLTAFNLCHVPEEQIHVSQLLNFFESSPNLHDILLHDSIPNSCDAPTKRVVSLPYLKELIIVAQPPHSILLNHLSIPPGALLHSGFAYSGTESPIPTYLPKSPDNLHNLSHITAANLHFGPEQRYARLSGPTGELYVLGDWIPGVDGPHAGTSVFFRTLLNRFDVSRIQWLTISLFNCQPHVTRVEEWSIYKTLRSMEELRTLTLTRCANLPFILTLNPGKNTSKLVLCPKLEEIILYLKRPDQFHINEILSMAEGRTSRGAKLLAITIVSMEALAPTKEVFQLRKHVSRVEYKFDDAPPEWDAPPATDITGSGVARRAGGRFAVTLS